MPGQLESQGESRQYLPGAYHILTTSNKSLLNRDGHHHPRGRQGEGTNNGVIVCFARTCDFK